MALAADFPPEAVGLRRVSVAEVVLACDRDRDRSAARQRVPQRYEDPPNAAHRAPLAPSQDPAARAQGDRPGARQRLGRALGFDLDAAGPPPRLRVDRLAVEDLCA